MSSSDDDRKPAQTGLVDMGNISFYNNTNDPTPVFNVFELAPYTDSFTEIVLNVTWAQLQCTENGPLSLLPINEAIAELELIRDPRRPPRLARGFR